MCHDSSTGVALGGKFMRVNAKQSDVRLQIQAGSLVLLTHLRRIKPFCKSLGCPPAAGHHDVEFGLVPVIQIKLLFT